MNFRRWSHEKINEQIVHAEAQVPCCVARFFEQCRCLNFNFRLSFGRHFLRFHSCDAHCQFAVWRNLQLPLNICAIALPVGMHSKRCSQFWWTNVQETRVLHSFPSLIDLKQSALRRSQSPLSNVHHLPVIYRLKNAEINVMPFISAERRRFDFHSRRPDVCIFTYFFVYLPFTRSENEKCAMKKYLSTSFFGNVRTKKIQLSKVSNYKCSLERPSVFHSTVSTFNHSAFFFFNFNEASVCSRMSQLSRHEQRKKKNIKSERKREDMKIKTNMEKVKKNEFMIKVKNYSNTIYHWVSPRSGIQIGTCLLCCTDTGCIFLNVIFVLMPQKEIGNGRHYNKVAFHTNGINAKRKHAYRSLMHRIGQLINDKRILCFWNGQK